MPLLIPVAPHWLGRAIAGAAVLLVLLLAGVRPAAATQATPSPEDVAAMLPEPGPLPNGTPRAEGPMPVVATTGILADLVRQVGGPRVEVVSLLPANADPHDFEPRPEDLVAVEDAALIVTHGLGLDEWATALIVFGLSVV
jgi:ABC-type Zn uptake system ZnuABC Zn-binding protein ZnuA